VGVKGLPSDDPVDAIAISLAVAAINLRAFRHILVYSI
jgi:hypothetical protein